VLDRNSELLGVPTLTLMENAGRGAARFILENYVKELREYGREPVICMICGKGNNGGDGFVVARHLAGAGCGSMSLLLLARRDEIKSEIARKNFRHIPGSVRIIEYGDGIDGFLIDEFLEQAKEEIDRADIVVDAMLGIGISGKLRRPYGEVIDTLNRERERSAHTDVKKVVVSLDVPSGFGGGTSVAADATITFHDLKEGMESLRRVEVVDIGIPGDARRCVGAGEFAYYPIPGKSAHKGDSGRLVIIGGGPFTGAPSLAACAAYGTGTDLVRIAVPASIASIIASFSMNFMVTPLGKVGEPSCLTTSHIKQLAPLMEIANAVVMGPGLGAAQETLDAAIALLEEHPTTPVVLDADVLTALSTVPTDERRKLLESRPCILTPHRGEFSRLSGVPVSELSSREEAWDAVASFAVENACTVLMKSSEDIIAGPREGELKVNRTGHPAMTVGGTGDVLAGCCGSFLAREIPPFAAARMAAHLNGIAGERAFDRKGWGMVATDVADEIPGVLMDLIARYNGTE